MNEFQVPFLLVYWVSVAACIFIYCYGLKEAEKPGDAIDASALAFVAGFAIVPVVNTLTVIVVILWLDSHANASRRLREGYAAAEGEDD